MQEVTFRDGQHLWWSRGEGRLLDWSPSQKKRKKIQGNFFQSVGWRFKKRKLTSWTPAVCPPSQGGESTGQSDSTMTPPGDEDKTHPWNSSFRAPGVQRHIWPFLQFLQLGMERGNGLWAAVLVHHCSARGKETPHQRDTA